MRNSEFYQRSFVSNLFWIRAARIRIRNDLFRIRLLSRQTVSDPTGSGSTTLGSRSLQFMTIRNISFYKYWAGSFRFCSSLVIWRMHPNLLLDVFFFINININTVAGWLLHVSLRGQRDLQRVPRGGHLSLRLRGSRDQAPRADPPLHRQPGPPLLCQSQQLLDGVLLHRQPARRPQWSEKRKAIDYDDLEWIRNYLKSWTGFFRMLRESYAEKQAKKGPNSVGKVHRLWGVEGFLGKLGLKLPSPLSITNTLNFTLLISLLFPVISKHLRQLTSLGHYGTSLPLPLPSLQYPPIKYHEIGC